MNCDKESKRKRLLRMSPNVYKSPQRVGKGYQQRGKEELDPRRNGQVDCSFIRTFAVHLSMWARGVYVRRALKRTRVFLRWGYLKVMSSLFFQSSG